MGNACRSSALSASRRTELEARFQALYYLIVRQKEAINEIGQDGASSLTAATVLRLLEREQAAALEELGYKPPLD